jgi:hypothetical protein
MKFFTEFAGKLSATVLNAAFPPKCCTKTLVAAANAGCFSCTTTHHQCNALTRVQTRTTALEIHWLGKPD